MKLHNRAVAANNRFEQKMNHFLRGWIKRHGDQVLLKFEQTLEGYLANDALRDFFLNTKHPLQTLLKKRFIARHLGRPVSSVFFDPVTGDPLLSVAEQRIYNLGRRMDSERMHVPFRSVHPVKQTEAGDVANISTYPEGSDIRYNSGNHFSSRPANGNVFEENSRRCLAKAGGSVQIFFKRGYMEERLQEIKTQTLALKETGENHPRFFVICSRHSPKEGHYAVSLVIMDPVQPNFPQRVLICDTLLKELPQHPRWWNYFTEEYKQVFGDAILEILEDLSHPLQKVNITGDNPYRHDWDCPYYAASMADALAELANNDQGLLLQGAIAEILEAMKMAMPDYYEEGGQVKCREDIRAANRLKRWQSGCLLISELVAETRRRTYL